MYSNGNLMNGTMQFNDYAIFLFDHKVKVTKKKFKLRILSSNELENGIDGLYISSVDKNRLIYKGMNPDNYIWLDENGDTKKQNNELYRIISFENDGTIKVIRDNSIGKYAWDQGINSEIRNNEENSFCIQEQVYKGCNVWGNLNDTLINKSIVESFSFGYYNSDNFNFLISDSKFFGSINQNASLNDFLNHDWLKTININNIIGVHSFYVGGIYYNKNYKGNDKGLLNEITEQNFIEWYGKVGLTNVTDIIETSISNLCTSVYSNLYNFSSDEFYCYNWLSKDNNNWTISAVSANNSSVWYIHSNGRVANNHNAWDIKNVRPVFYIKSDFSILGEGTKANPYIIENF